MQHKDYDLLILDEQNAISYIADVDNHELLHLTKGAMALLGINSHEDYAGEKCYKVLQGLDAPCSFCTNHKLHPGEKYYWEHFNTKLQRWLTIEDRLVTIGDRRCRLEFAKEINEQKEQMRRLTDQLTLEQILVKCLQTLASAEDYSQAFNSFLEQLGRYYRANRAYIFEFDLKEQVINNTYEWCAPNVSAEIENLQNVEMKYISSWMKKFKESGEFFISSLDDDLKIDSDEHAILAAQGIKSLMAAPLLFDGEIVGFIGVDDPTYSIGDLTLLRASSDFVIEELKKRHLFSQLEYASYTDMLTGLKNRNSYNEILRQYESATPSSIGIIFADINGLKAVNDAHGHAYGDRLLVRVAELLKNIRGCQIFRIGGDEFVLLFENVNEDVFQTKVCQLKELVDKDTECDLSLGCIWKQGELDVNNLLIRADELMYAEKQSYYKEVLKHGQNTRIGIANEVISDIDSHRFVAYYQPQVNIKTGQIIGAEALVRKIGDDGNIIPPDRFIPYYEIEGIIRYIDMFVLEEACASLVEWQKEGRDLNISVNFSRVTLMEPNIVEDIMEICTRYGVSPRSLTLEVTESISRMERDHLHALISRLMLLGFTISLDDFGSKYSNLAILGDMQFNTVKFDRELVDRLENNDKSRIIMRNSIRMCHELEDTHTLAEGIETEGQVVLLRNYECELGQGYFFSRPVSVERFNEILDEADQCDNVAD